MTTTAGTTLPTAPDLLIEAADTIGNRSAERDSADGAAYLALACECVERELDMPF